MNLNELDDLIIRLDPKTDQDLITFYQRKRLELVKQIWKNVERNFQKDQNGTL